jgi:hypothetical protein
MTEAEWNAPCERCGCEILRITHLGFFGAENHSFRKNVVTGEMLDTDPCDALIAGLT